MAAGTGISPGVLAEAPAATSPVGRAGVSVVIPTLADESAITGAVRSAFAAGADEVVVADGGSTDRTVELARAAGAQTLQAPRGRGSQLNAGAAAAEGEVLCFLHTNVRMTPRGIDSIREALLDPRVAGGNFRVRFGETLHGRFLAAFYHVIRRLGLYYGDSTIFCRRRAFRAAGGFPPYPIMEDVALVNRLRRAGRMAYLGDRVSASRRR